MVGKPPGPATLAEGMAGPLGRTTARSGQKVANRTTTRPSRHAADLPARTIGYSQRLATTPHRKPASGPTGQPFPQPGPAGRDRSPDHVVRRPNGPTILHRPERRLHHRLCLTQAADKGIRLDSSTFPCSTLSASGRPPGLRPPIRRAPRRRSGKAVQPDQCARLSPTGPRTSVGVCVREAPMEKTGRAGFAALHRVRAVGTPRLCA